GPDVTVIGRPPRIKKRKGRGRAQQTIDLIRAMEDIIQQCAPITGRGVGYKLFTRKLIPSMSRKDMHRVYRLLKEEREYGTIPWEAIVDESRGLEIAKSWQNPDGIRQADDRGLSPGLLGYPAGPRRSLVRERNSARPAQAGVGSVRRRLPRAARLQQ